MKLTTGLIALIENYKKQLSTTEYEKIKSDIEDLFSYYLKDLSCYSAGAERGKRLHFLLNSEMTKASQKDVSCKKGCAACCHYEVEITRDDAEVLKEALRFDIKIDLEKLSTLSKRERLSSEWKKGIVPENKCLFLNDNNSCQVYEARPLACRKLIVISEPFHCEDTSGHPLPKVLPTAEILLSVAINLENNECGSLSKMLSQALMEDMKFTIQPKGESLLQIPLLDNTTLEF